MIYSISTGRTAILASAIVGITGLLAQNSEASNWNGGNGNWSSNSTTGWNGTGVPNSAGAVASHPGAATTITAQDIVAGVTVGTIALTNNSNNSWTITNTNGITMNQDGAGAGVASITNSNTTANTTTFINVGNAVGTITLADDLLVSNTSASTTAGGAIQITSSISGTGNITFVAPAASASAVTGTGTFPGAIRSQTGTNTFTGSVLIKSGALTTNQSTVFGNSTNAVTIGASGQGSATFMTTSGSLTIPQNITVAGSSGGTIMMGSISTGNGTFSGSVTLNDNLTLTSATTGTGGSVWSGNITGSGFGITKVGATGLTVLSGTNTYTGGTTITAGTLQLGNAGATGTLSPTGGITNNSIFAIKRTGTITQGTDFGTISGTGAFNQIGSGTVVLSGSNTYTGITSISTGVLSVVSLNSVTGGTSSSSLGVPANATTGTIGMTGGTLRYAGTGSGETTDRIVDMSGNGSIAIDQSGSGLLKFTSNLGVSGAAARTLTLSGSSSGTGEFAGVISDNSGTNTTAITKSGTGQWTFSNANTYTGGTTISGGTLALSGSGTTGPTTGSILLSGGSLDLGGNSRTVGSVSISAAAATDTLLNGNITPSSLSVSNTTGTAVISANVVGGTGLSKSGAGKLTLTGTDTYSGSTTVTGGTLVVNGSIVSSTAISGTAILGGSGTISGAVSIADGSLAPGNSPGTLTISNTLALASTSSLNYELLGTDLTIGGGVNDLTTGVTNLTLDGTLNVTETVAGSFLSANVGDTWRLINYSGSLTDNTLALGTMPTLSQPYMSFALDTATSGQVNLTIVPEPTTLAVIGLSFGALLRRRREI